MPIPDFEITKQYSIRYIPNKINKTLPEWFEIDSFIDKQQNSWRDITELNLKDNHLLYYLYIYPKELKLQEMLDYINYNISPYWVIDAYRNGKRFLHIYRRGKGYRVWAVEIKEREKFPVSIEYCKELIEEISIITKK